MAQTAPPPPDAGTPRPLPRGGRPTRARDTRPRFQLLDAVWMALAAAVFLVLGLERHADAAARLTATGVVLLTYLLGWRSAGRPAGVIAALLLAASAPFASSATHSVQTDLFALVGLGALFAFVAGSSLAALALAAAAVWLRADGIALGLMLLTFTLAQQRRRAPLGALIFFAPTLAALFVPHADGGHPFSTVTFGLHPGPLSGLTAPAMLFTAWFLLPFLGEMADSVRRARWLPTVVWTLLGTAMASYVAFGHAAPASAALVPLLPLWFLLAGAGLARLLPVMTGDLPIPRLRYAVATLGVLSLLAIRAHIEWTPTPRPAIAAPVVLLPVPTLPVAPLPRPVARSPKPAPVIPHPATVAQPPKPAVAHPAVTVKPQKPHPAQAPKPRAPKPRAVKHTPAQPAVRQYVMQNGRLVHRSKWAIQWDQTHPRP